MKKRFPISGLLENLSITIIVAIVPTQQKAIKGRAARNPSTVNTLDTLEEKAGKYPGDDFLEDLSSP